MPDSSEKPNGKPASQVNRVAGVAEDRLRAFVERIEALDGDIKGLNSDKSEVYSEAKGSGFDLKALRVVIRRRAMSLDDRIEQDHLVDLYERALNGGIVEREPQAAPERNQAAYDAGKADALAGTRENAERWSEGAYGAVDYSLGYQDGEREGADPLGLGETEEKLADLKKQMASRARTRTRGTRRAAEAFAS